MTAPSPSPVPCSVPGCDADADGLYPGQDPCCPAHRAEATALGRALTEALSEAADAANAASVESSPSPCVCGGGPAIATVPGTQGQLVPLCQRCVDDLTVRMVLARVRSAEPISC
jgi:hypothetical protein